MRIQNSTQDIDHGKSRNAFVFGFTPQAELWNGRFAMLSLTLYFLSLFNNFSIVHNFLPFVSFFGNR